MAPVPYITLVLGRAESHLQVGGACLHEAVEEAALQQPTKRAPKEEELVALVSRHLLRGFASFNMCPELSLRL
jgi:hypothetical protein